MKNMIRLAVGASILGGVFVAGLAVGKTSKDAKFIERTELKWDDVGGPKVANITGDYKKGAYMGLLTIPAGFTSPMHSHSGDYEAVQIEGTSSHWFKGDDGTKAKKMTPGSYWSMPAKIDHVSACDKGKDCVMLLIQKSKFDFTAAKEAVPKKEEPKKPEPAKKM